MPETVHIIKQHTAHECGFCVYDEPTGVLIAGLTEHVARMIAFAISDQVEMVDATT